MEFERKYLRKVLDLVDYRIKDNQERIDVLMKSLKKGIDDEFLKIYFDYQEAAKQCGTYGQNYFKTLNPKTGRIHTKFKQLGVASGRMSCGGGLADKDTDLAKYKGLPPGRCSFVQIQNLPSDRFVFKPINLSRVITFFVLRSTPFSVFFKSW